MKQHLIKIMALVAVGTYCQAQDVITASVESSAPESQHSATQLIARNQISQRASVIYTAGQSVVLQPGFQAKAGSIFTASIRTLPTEQTISKNLTMTAYPNPFRQDTRVEYVLPRNSQVRGVLTNLQGQVVKQPANVEWQEAGAHQLDLSGSDLPAGTYIYQLQTGTEQKSIRLIKQP
ncbi:T9SS type A sorting domain-containing protein [Spirosoma sp. BT702]|uniref:T9SS type A sorting domain-containing protein n=1 Tax=Spirosoma profusum TaxID=2771354 RepID=A0A927AU66_9BACT|nr:T9SS type A sorting domain-containing protein [Spirosoma profusum]MBD2702702.1 T9SS type A sorting domain-containing protein [Spirosoma profusum]